MATQSETVTSKSLQVDPAGHAVIPDGVEEIAYGAFSHDYRIVTLTIPDSVKRIQKKAFLGCRNLREIRFGEGLESIESFAFEGCTSLTRLILPDSLRRLADMAFYRSGLMEPVYNRSRTILFFYPDAIRDTLFVLPDTVKRLHTGAFRWRTEEDSQWYLEQLILPEGLEQIDNGAFWNARIQEVLVRSFAVRVAPQAFFRCVMKHIDFYCPLCAVSDNALCSCAAVRITNGGQGISFEEELRIRGVSLIAYVFGIELPQEPFWEEAAFLALAEECSSQAPHSMMTLADYYENRGDSPFFRYAANFWRYRASTCGDRQAQEWKERLLSENPRQRIPAAFSGSLQGREKGKYLRALGFLFFEPEREYTLEGLDENGVVVVSADAGESGPDRDGFGREEEYDWWMLDEDLRPIPGVPCVAECSYNGRNHGARFSKVYDRAADNCRNKRKERNCP